MSTTAQDQWITFLASQGITYEVIRMEDQTMLIFTPSPKVDNWYAETSVSFTPDGDLLRLASCAT